MLKNVLLTTFIFLFLFFTVDNVSISLCIYKNFLYSVFKHLNIDTYTRRTLKYKVNILCTNYTMVSKKKKEKNWGTEQNSTDMDIYLYISICIYIYLYIYISIYI